MKKIFTLIISMVCATALSQAQGTTDQNFKFVNEEGAVVADGTTLTLTELTEDPFGLANYISTGLSVINDEGDDDMKVCVEYTIEQIDNGEFQVCFPITCNNRSETGTWATSSGSLMPGEKRDLQCEWIPADYGTCKAKLTLKVDIDDEVSDGPTVHLVFKYRDPASVNGIQADDSAAEYYTVGGLPTEQPRHGLNIVRKADGSSVKQIIR